ncbi:FAD-dependent oxidoreductase [Beijerinckia mobilis]|uniref:FAD-dependent oxidoreductase n=1 Tax=Beijerinckia mobilis TaxID=231434 RepID=UPI0006907F94|nr:GMC family oxidoreductase [Beijerinckia mobilis]
MIYDGRSIEHDASIMADVCIVGGGPGGLTLAMELEASNLKTVLLESGGTTPDFETQSLYRADNVGINYVALEKARSRFLGGSSNCWGGWCKPMDALDFEARHWIPESGWPFGFAEIERYYSRAHKYLQLYGFDYTVEGWAAELKQKDLRPFAWKNTTFRNQLVQFSPPVRYGLLYYDRLVASKTATVITWANATEIEVDPTSCAVTGVQVKTLTNNSFKIKARYVVLAAGGIENARLLLASNRVQENGLGNTYDVVGRYFMDHPRVRTSTLTLNDVKHTRQLYDVTIAQTTHHEVTIAQTTHPSGVNPNKIAAYVAPTEQSQREFGLPNSRTYVRARYAFDSSEFFKALQARRLHQREVKRYAQKPNENDGLSRIALLMKLLKSPLGAVGALDVIMNPQWVSRRFDLETVIEPIPNPDSRVYLSPEKDQLGMHRACVDWRLTEQDYTNISKTAQLLREVFVKDNVGQLVDPDQPIWDGNLSGCHHHMGTTRIHNDRKRGVVDANLKVHDIPNLYCVGSSVFPTVGSDCPTLPLVALAIRLGDWLKAQDAVSCRLADSEIS